MKISILTAVYNAAPFLPQCLDSVMAQTFADWQMVCVDDASADASLSIIERYAAADSRIQVVHLDKNQGAAHARNEAFRLTDGDVVMMLDADDWLAPDALAQIAAEFERDERTDCVLFDLQMYYSDNDVRPFCTLPELPVSGYEALRMSIGWHSLHGVYAVRRRLHELHPYDESSHTFSDDNTTRFHYLDSRQVAFSHAAYFYRQRTDSSSHKIGISRFMVLEALFALRTDLIADGRIKQPEIDTLDTYIWHNIQGAYMIYYACRRTFSAADRRRAATLLRTCHRRCCTKHLPLLEHLRFGYAPIKWCPAVYRLQMRVFTHLRLLLGLDRHRYD